MNRIWSATNTLGLGVCALHFAQQHRTQRSRLDEFENEFVRTVAIHKDMNRQLNDMEKRIRFNAENTMDIIKIIGRLNKKVDNKKSHSSWFSWW